MESCILNNRNNNKKVYFGKNLIFKTIFEKVVQLFQTNLIVLISYLAFVFL